MTQPNAAAAGDPLLKLAYEAADKVLQYQQVILQNLRNRASGVLVTSVVLLALPNSLGLASSPAATVDKSMRASPIPLWTSWSLLGITAVISTLMLVTLWPLNGWTFSASAKRIIDLRDHGRDEAYILNEQTKEMISATGNNFALLAKKQQFYRISIALLLPEAAVLTLGIVLA